MVGVVGKLFREYQAGSLPACESPCLFIEAVVTRVIRVQIVEATLVAPA